MGSSTRSSKKKSSARPLPLWRMDSEYGEIYKAIKGRTVIPPANAYNLYNMAKHAGCLPGDIAEVGVYKGGSAYLLGKVIDVSKTIFLFDTFTGMPKSNLKIDKHIPGDFKDTSVEDVAKFLETVHARYIITPGFFPKTAANIRDKTFSFVHCDADLYNSVMSCCEFFYPRLVGGGILMFDDYGFDSCPGAKRAVDEFFSALPENPIPMISGQCFVVKKPRILES